MQVWRSFRDKLRAAWYRRENRKVIMGIVIGLSLIVGMGLGMYRAWPAEQPTAAANTVTREELDDLVLERVQSVIATLYPWVLDGPTQVVMVEPPVNPLPEPTEPKPEPEPEPEPVVSFERLIWPVQGEITTPFGWYRHPVYGDWRFNAGVEFAASGEAVRTVLPGKVAAVNSNGLEMELIIEHGSGWASIYRSVTGITVGPGEQVKQNQNIAVPDGSGRVFFGLTHNGQPVNPEAFLH